MNGNRFKNILQGTASVNSFFLGIQMSKEFLVVFYSSNIPYRCMFPGIMLKGHEAALMRQQPQQLHQLLVEEFLGIYEFLFLSLGIPF